MRLETVSTMESEAREVREMVVREAGEECRSREPALGGDVRRFW